MAVKHNHSVIKAPASATLMIIQSNSTPPLTTVTRDNDVTNLSPWRSSPAVMALAIIILKVMIPVIPLRDYINLLIVQIC